MRQYSYILFLLTAFIVFTSGKRDKQAVSMLGKEVKDFSLLNIDGKKLSLSSNADAKGYIIIFTCNHCPFAKLYTQRMNALHNKYKKKGVYLLAVNPMDTLVYEEEGIANMKKWAKTQGYSFPYLQDGTQAVAKMFGALHTPQAYVIWKENNKWIIKYSGAIDDNGQHPEKAVPFVANAVAAFLVSKQTTQPETISLGCKINYR